MLDLEEFRNLKQNADEEYRRQVAEIINIFVPGISKKKMGSILHKVCTDRYADSIDEIILMEYSPAYKNKKLKDLLVSRIEDVKEKNKGFEPSIDKRYWCETCGSHSHECHPGTGYCFHCDTDNWKAEK